MCLFLYISISLFSFYQSLSNYLLFGFFISLYIYLYLKSIYQSIRVLSFYLSTFFSLSISPFVYLFICAYFSTLCHITHTVTKCFYLLIVNTRAIFIWSFMNALSSKTHCVLDKNKWMDGWMDRSYSSIIVFKANNHDLKCVLWL